MTYCVRTPRSIPRMQVRSISMVDELFRLLRDEVISLVDRRKGIEQFLSAVPKTDLMHVMDLVNPHIEDQFCRRRSRKFYLDVEPLNFVIASAIIDMRRA